MKINRPGLRAELLILLLALLAPVFIGVGHWQMSRAFETQQQEQLDHLSRHGRGLQPLLLDLLAGGELRLAERQLAQLSDIHGIALALVLDSANRVIVGNRPGAADRTLFAVDPGIDRHLPRLAKAQALVTADGSLGLVYLPFATDALAGAQETPRWLVFSVDLGHTLPVLVDQAGARVAAVLAIVTAVALLAWLWAWRRIARPLAALRERAAAPEAAGRRTLPPGAPREVAEVAAAFDGRAARERQARRELERSNRFNAIRAAVRSALLREDEEPALLRETCALLAGDAFRLVAVAVLDDSRAALRTVASAGDKAGFLGVTDQEARIDINPLATGVLLGEEVVCPLADQSRETTTWHVEAANWGFQEAAAFPLRRGKSVVGGLMVFADRTGWLDEAGQQLLREIASDLSFGLERLANDREREAARLNLAHDRSLLRALIDCIPDLIFFKDNAQVYLGCNAAFEQLVARSEDYLVGATDHDVFGEVQARAFREEDATVLASGKPRRFKEWLEYPDGRRVLLDMVRTPYLGQDGRALGLVGVGRDITQEQLAREELEHALDLLQQAERIAALGSWVYEPDSDTFTGSAETLRLLGMPAEHRDFPRPLLDERYDPADRERMTGIGERLHRRELGDFDIEFRLQVGGTTRFLYLQGRRELRDDHQEHYVGTLQDVTARKLAEDELQRREAYLRATADLLPFLIWMKDTGGRFLAVNKVFADTLGQTGPRALEGRTDADIWPAEVAEGHASDDVRVMESGRQRTVEETVEIHGESRLFETYRAPVYDLDQRLLGTVGFARDITEQRAAEQALVVSEQRFRAAARTANDLVYEWEPQTGRLEWFGDIDRALGCAPGEAPRRLEDWIALVHPADRALLEERSAQMRREGGEYDLSYRVRGPDERWLHWVDRGSLIDLPSTGSRVIGRCADVSPIVRAAEDRLVLERELLQAQKMEALGQLTGGIAHDFNNMLAAIIGFSDLARRRLPELSPEKLGGYLERINDSANRARELIAQILAFSRGEDREAVPLNLTPLVKETLKLVRSTLPAGIEIRSHADPGLPPVLIEPVEFNQLLLNLCVNARDALPDKGLIQVRLTRTRLEKSTCSACTAEFGGDFIELSVTDNGRGIPAEVRGRLFTPFFSSKSEQGSGMGLAVVHRIVSQRGGHILLESTEGEGTSFRLFLPPATSRAPAQAAPAPRAAAAPQPLAHGERVVVVDDEASMVEFLREFLEVEGFTVDAFLDSRAALGHFADVADRVSLVVTDQNMPNLLGTELAQAVKKIRPDVKTVLITGFSNRVNKVNAASFGVDCYLEKPLASGELRACLQRMLA